MGICASEFPSCNKLKTAAISRNLILVCVALMLTGPEPHVTATDQVVKQTEFGLGRQGSAELEELSDGTCILFRTFFVSDRFFFDFRRIETTVGTKFKKAGKPVEFFPEHLILDLEANVYKCGKDNPIQHSPLDFKSELMKSLTFRAQWKRVFDLRPAQIVAVQTRGPSKALFANRWEYFLDVPTRDVPLGDSFIIDVLDRNGETIRRLSARL